MSNSILTNFEIHIRQPLNDGAFPVTVRVPDVDQLIESRLRLPVDAAAVSDLLADLVAGLADPTAAEAIGAQLFDALFQGQIKDLYLATRARLGQAFRYRLLIDAPIAAKLPWELLYDPQRRVFLALETPLVRGFGLAEPAQPLQVQPPLRILISAPFPADLPPIAGQDEIDHILHELAKLVQRKEAEVTPLFHTTLRSLQDTLREATEQGRPFHVLHIIGHGALDPKTGRALLYFENDLGQAEPVDPASLADILRPFNLKLIYLNACESLALSAFDLTQGFAPALMAIGTPAVIGMQVAVWDQVAGQMAQDFYASLADNQPVDRALLSARQLARSEALAAAGIAIPVCYLRTASGQIIDLTQPAAPQLTRATWRPWLKAQAQPKKLVAGIIGLIGLISAVLSIYWGIKAFLPAPDPAPISPMSGDYNIAVAAFTTRDERGRALRNEPGVQLAHSVAEQIETATQDLRNAGFTIALYGPQQTGAVDGASAEERSANAESLADALNADLLLYGDVVLREDYTGLYPRVLVSPQRLLYAEDLAGDYAFGAPLETADNITTNPVASMRLREQLAQRASSLAQFALGMGYFKYNELTQAEHWFDAALRSGTADPKLQRLALLFLGSAAAYRDDLPTAQSYYQQALQIDPRYARAQLGSAQVAFLQAKGDCVEGQLDPQVVEAALEGYQRALLMDSEPSDHIPSKVNAMLGDIYLCQSLATPSDQPAEAAALRAKAEAAYRAVADRYTATGAPGLRYLAVAAWQGLGGVGLAASATQNPAGSAQEQAAYRDGLAQAEAAYRQAIELGRSPSSLATSYLSLAFTHALHGQCQAASEALNAAAASHQQAIASSPTSSSSGYQALRAAVEDSYAAACPAQ